MCECKNIEIGSYGNQVVIEKLPSHMADYKAKAGGAPSICLDKCVSEEVQHLWSLGITTTGCCCGHNKQEGYIGVILADIPRMKLMGYKVQFNHNRPGDEDSFYPKSIVAIGEKKETESFIVALKYNEYTNKFFVDFSNESGNVISLLISEGEATGLSRSMKLKIMLG